MSDNKKVSAPIRMSPELLEKVRIASDRTGIAQADILRICLAIGLEDLRRINYDISTAILDLSRREQTTHLRVAEEPGNDQSHSSGADGVRSPVKYPAGRRHKS